MQVKPEQYIYPPRPADAIPRDQTSILGEMQWLAQLKYNDTRCLIKFLPQGTTELWNRHGERIRNYTAPDWLLAELQQIRQYLGEGYHLLDGGLLDSKHKAIKDTLVIWDILVHNGTHLLGSTYESRYHKLRHLEEPLIPWMFSHEQYEAPIQFGLAYTPHIFLPENHQASKWPELWQLIEKVNAPWATAGPLIEGLVFKNPQGTLGMGFKEKNNSDWLMRSRVRTGRHIF